MDQEILRQHYVRRGESEETVRKAIGAVQEFEMLLDRQGRQLEDAKVDDLKAHVASLIAEDRNSENSLLALARYFYLTGQREIYIYFTSLFGNAGVLENIRDRIAAAEGEDVAAVVFDGVSQPPLGAPRETLPPVTARLMRNLTGRLPDKRCRQLLAGNNHGIPREAFAEEKAIFDATASLDDYLTGLHQRNVEELEQHALSGQVWFEQIITPAVVEFVRANPEIQSAVRHGDRLFVTKIPYDTPGYLQAADPDERKYCLCHCPFVREALRRRDTSVDPRWCYCSGGFVKFQFDVLFDADLEVELLESPLLGDERCRFAIRLPDQVVAKLADQ